MNDIEEWKDIKGYEGLYQVSNYGRIKSLDRIVTQKTNGGHLISREYKGKILKQSKDDDGYLVVTLNKQDGGKSKRVNVLVANAWIPNPQNKHIVGHLKTLPNGLEDKTANEIWNLAWLTPKENSNYGTLSERKSNNFKKLYAEGKMKKVWLGKKRQEHAQKLSKPIIEIKEDGTIKEWDSIIGCSRVINCSATHLTNAVNGKNHQRGHYFRNSQWYFKNDYEKMLEEQLLLS